MGTIDDYLQGLGADDRAAIARVYDIARSMVGEATQGTSYGMPALMYRGKPLISVMRTRRHIGVYPFSGRVPAAVGTALDGFDHAKGTIRFVLEHPLPDDAIRAVVDARRAEIEKPSVRSRGAVS